MRYPRTAAPIVRTRIISDTQRTNPVAYVSLGTWHWVEKLARSDLNQCVEPNANPSRATSRSCPHSRTRASAFAARAVAAPSLISLLLRTTRDSAGPDSRILATRKYARWPGAPADLELSCATARRAKQPRRRRDRCRRHGVTRRGPPPDCRNHETPATRAPVLARGRTSASGRYTRVAEARRGVAARASKRKPPPRRRVPLRPHR